MSRIAKQKINIPSGVSCEVLGSKVVCQGPLGKNTIDFPDYLKLNLENNGSALTAFVTSVNDQISSALVGSAVANLKNAVTGVVAGFKQQINFVGVGYKGIKNNNIFEVSLGYSHTIKFEIPEGVDLEVKKPNEFLLSSSNKQLLGDVCSKLEKLRKVEPYKGKGVVKVGKFYLRKEGKKK